jgi:hypothetical protein
MHTDCSTHLPSPPKKKRKWGKEGMREAVTYLIGTKVSRLLCAIVKCPSDACPPLCAFVLGKKMHMSRSVATGKNLRRRGEKYG